MHFSRMRTARSFTVSRHIPCMPPWQPHTPPPATMHAPQQPCMPPPVTTHTPQQSCMPPATTHAPRQPCMSQQPRTPPGNHSCPPATMHAPCNHAHPPATTHAPQQPCMAPLVDRITDACENITLPQLRCGR